MLFQLILVVVILVALAYMWNTGRPAMKSSFKGENPFKGRYKPPPPRSSNHTIDKGSMTRCHNCSCFFPEGQVIREVVEGHILEFCSENCKHHFHVPRS